jgi:ATP-dependent DNA helicase DinG
MLEAKVLAAFTELGFTPRDLQVKSVMDVLDAFASGKRHVFLDAPTGSGKSLLALVIQKVLDIQAVVVTATNALGEQYERDYDDLLLVMGAGQYPCEAREVLFKKDAFADTCYRKSRFFYSLAVEPKECGTCKFKFSREEKTKRKIAVTNYPYFIIDQLYIKPMEGPHGEPTNPSAWHLDLAIFDEAHLINEQFSQHYVIHYSKARGREFLHDISKMLGENSGMEEAYSGVFRIIDENIDRGSIGRANHLTFVLMLERFYRKMMEVCESMKGYCKVEETYDMLEALRHKYHGLFCKIDDYKKYGYEVVIETIKGESFSVQPVFIGAASEHLLQPLNLFMSATLNYDFMVATMELNPDECQLVKVGYSFNVDDKTIDFSRAREKVNYNNMFSDKVIYAMIEDLEAILVKHSTENGVVITTSFKMAEELSHVYSGTHELIVHRSTEPAKEVIARFKESSKPTVLFSPSLFEGVDLPGDISTFQVLPKAPYLSLGSKRMFHISRKHRAIYLQMTIKRMIQSFGRSTRSTGDKSMTYVLDLNAEKLFRSKYNAWKDQFKVIK